MIITNKYNVSETLVRAVKNDLYTKGDANISVTGLLSPPQARYLEEKHYDEIEVDVTDRLAALDGQAMHYVLERASEGQPNLLTEKIIYTHYLGWKIKGQFDSVTISEGLLEDLKNCSPGKVSAGKIPEEWVQQTNIYKRMLQKEKGLVINRIKVTAIIKGFNWQLAETKVGYPHAPSISLDIPVWDDDTIDAFIEERVRLHQAPEPQPCSEKDIWARSASWAVIKRGNIRALRVYDNPDEAAQLASTNSALYVEHRPGVAVRCSRWCHAAPFCPQWAVDPRNKSIPSITEELFNA
jgi:hypothetical protein